ncbi:unnamed protein product [Clavelina lepadiformis]|uniref:Uncharacterized protein n=1 Tax=Clavelina lepadiformis TaxID=159417 RepID=A0ABP0GNF2_CLALP
MEFIKAAAALRLCLRPLVILKDNLHEFHQREAKKVETRPELKLQEIVPNFSNCLLHHSQMHSAITTVLRRELGLSTSVPTSPGSETPPTAT